jgi:poly-gamma-glutamate synthesis protein (capsule biosynthesis protein)
MAANNSSAFNFRVVDGTQRLSQHALGRAVDINPLQNPWRRGARVDPEAGSAYLDRAQLRPGMIVRPGPVIAAFEAAGWSWGGDVADAPDFHHFSKP